MSKRNVKIFYRNRPGKDPKVLGFTEDLEAANPNEFVRNVNMQFDPGSYPYQEVDEYGAFTKKVVNGVLVNRDPADLAKDCARKQPMIIAEEKQIIEICQGRERVTWIMLANENMWKYLNALQAAMNIQDSQLSAEGQAAKAQVQWIRSNISGPISQIMIDRDTAIGLLDQED